MLNNLRAEMARTNISATDLAKTINKSDRAVRDKIRGLHEFTVSEVVAIRDAHFPACSLEYLFASSSEI